MRKIAIASDHAGFHLKSKIIKHYQDRYEWIDLGPDSTDSVDYPDFEHKVSEKLSAVQFDLGILCC